METRTHPNAYLKLSSGFRAPQVPWYRMWLGATVQAPRAIKLSVRSMGAHGRVWDMGQSYVGDASVPG